MIQDLWKVESPIVKTILKWMYHNWRTQMTAKQWSWKLQVLLPAKKTHLNQVSRIFGKQSKVYNNQANNQEKPMFKDMRKFCGDLLSLASPCPQGSSGLSSELWQPRSQFLPSHQRENGDLTCKLLHVPVLTCLETTWNFGSRQNPYNFTFT